MVTAEETRRCGGVYLREESGSYYFALSSRKTNGGVYNTVRGNTALTSGTWYYVTYSTNGSVWKIRVNGATAQTLTAVLGTNTGDWIGDVSPSTPDKSDIGGIYAGGAYSSVNFWHGILDEVRLSNVERSDDWVSTEYNNQSSPTTFYTISSATSGVSQAHWLVTDHLGTPRVIVDQTGSLASVSRHDYLPFGEELFTGTGVRTTSIGYTGSDAVRQQFTSKERDNETGLDYFLARYYSSAQGRFTSADAPFADQSLDDPQSWNLYTYVRNNRLRSIDPNGRNMEGDLLERIRNAADGYGFRTDAEVKAETYRRLSEIRHLTDSTTTPTMVHLANPNTGEERYVPVKALSQREIWDISNMIRNGDVRVEEDFGVPYVPLPVGGPPAQHCRRREGRIENRQSGRREVPLAESTRVHKCLG